MYPLPGERYQHYKGGIYEIISMATHTETKEIMVVYKSINFGSVYVRPYDIFDLYVPDDSLKKKFTKI